MKAPEQFASEVELDEFMTRPSPELCSSITRCASPLVILGAGGKMGPTLAVLAKRAAREARHDLAVIAVSRFSNAPVREWLHQHGVETMACDLFDECARLALPEAKNLIYLVGLKFGTTEAPEKTWAANTLIPFFVSRRYPGAAIVALSSGNVYPLVAADLGGSVESDPLLPLGEYANACVARERLFEHASARFGTRVVSIRLNYALDLRYGVLVDLASKIVEGRPVDLTMGYLNVIWQGDANELILRAMGLARRPPDSLNVTGIERLSVRDLAAELGRCMEREVRFEGEEASTALLSNVSRMAESLGAPRTPLDVVLKWTARWVLQGGNTIGKPTHFEVRDGNY